MTVDQEKRDRRYQRPPAELAECYALAEQIKAIGDRSGKTEDYTNMQATMADLGYELAAKLLTREGGAQS